MIHTTDNFLDADVLNNLRQKYEDAKGSGVFEVNKLGSRWGSGLEHGSYAPVLILNLDEYREYFLEKYLTVAPIFADYRHLTCFMHVWLPGSKINFHHDALPAEQGSRLSSTIYLNENWNADWGGLFLYDDPDLGKGWIYPQGNSMVWFMPPILHAISMVSADAAFPRLSVQMFFNKDPG